MKIFQRFLISLTISATILTISFWVKPTVTHSHTESQVTLSGNALLASNRSELAFCIDKADLEQDISLERLADNLQIALAKVKDAPRWREIGYDQFSMKVDVGCPRKPYLLQPGATHPLLSGEAPTVQIPMTDKPSPYRVHVYIVPQTEIQDSFGLADMRSSAEEMLCTGNVCYEVTSGIYLTLQDATNLQILQNRVERVLAIDLTDITGQANSD